MWMKSNELVRSSVETRFALAILMWVRRSIMYGCWDRSSPFWYGYEFPHEIICGCKFEGRLSGNINGDKSTGVKCVGILKNDDIGLVVSHGFKARICRWQRIGRWGKRWLMGRMMINKNGFEMRSSVVGNCFNIWWPRGLVLWYHI